MHSEDNCKACQELNAIALGIEIRFDSLLGYSRLVTQKTIEAARNIGTLAPPPNIDRPVTPLREDLISY